MHVVNLQVPYKPYLSTQFSTAYDTYLEIQHRINKRIDVALHHDSPNWRLLNTCPSCFYKLEDEPALTFSCLLSMDGNNSLKWLGMAVHNKAARLDNRSLESDLWITPQEVNHFKNEVPSRKATSTSDNWEDADSEDPLNCINRWQNAAPEARKKMFTLFDESGVFIMVCQHRFVLLACDMIKSGEL